MVTIKEAVQYIIQPNNHRYRVIYNVSLPLSVLGYPMRCLVTVVKNKN